MCVWGRGLDCVSLFVYTQNYILASFSGGQWSCLFLQTCLCFAYIPWIARRSNQSILKEISPEYSLEGLILKLKLQYFGHLMWRVDSLEKTLILGEIEGGEEKGTTEDEVVGWHHQLDAHEFAWTPGAGDGQGGLVCCDSWDRKESDTTEWLNWTELNSIKYVPS